ncbi:MAG: ATP-binding protein [Acidobacteriota bacterium]
MLIHATAFVVLYLAVYRIAVGEILRTHKVGAAILLDEVEFVLGSYMQAHDASTVRATIKEQSRTKHAMTLHLFDPRGLLVASNDGAATEADTSEYRKALDAAAPGGTAWSTREDGGYRLYGTRLIANSPQCFGCHDPRWKSTGTIQMALDLTPYMDDARGRLRLHLGILAAVWIGLLLVMTRVKDKVIGQPIARIKRTIADAGLDTRPAGDKDLDALASNLHEALWELIEKQRRREQSITTKMARAEQLAALGELAAGLTHEIKNPLAGIAAAVEVLRSELPAEQTRVRQIHDEILREVARVSATLDGLLSVARPRPPQRKEVDLGSIVRDVVVLVDPRLRGRGIKLDVEAASVMPKLSLDPGLITQLLLNLLNNSIQALPSGGRIAVLLSPFPKNDGVVLVVADTGQGIEAQHLERIFEPFFTTKEHGTGLGLTICRQIVEQHGGTISVESERGKGTKVVILLPMSAKGSGSDGPDTAR